MYKTIIAGSRTTTPQQFNKAMSQFPYLDRISEVVCGGADGTDTYGDAWARYRNIPVTPFYAEWNNLDLPFCVVKTRKDGTKYNAAAGAYRNKLMAEYADLLILIYDGKSDGSKDMLKKAKQNGLKYWIYDTTDDAVFYDL